MKRPQALDTARQYPQPHAAGVASSTPTQDRTVAVVPTTTRLSLTTRPPRDSPNRQGNDCRLAPGCTARRGSQSGGRRRAGSTTEQLGHTSAAMTLDTYAALFEQAGQAEKATAAMEARFGLAMR